MLESLLARNALTILQPLQSLPSMLAIRDVRRRVMATRPNLDDTGQLVALLGLDPLSCLRVLRLAHAPMLRGRAPRDVGLAGIVRFLGTAAVARTLDVPVVDPDRTRRLRRLWFHSIATAVAAERLARRHGSMAPELAYLRGLLHDLTPWLHLLGMHHNGAPGPLDGPDLTRAWNLPLDAETLSAKPVPVDRPLDDILHERPARLLAVAAQLADLAGFPLQVDDSDSHRRAVLTGSSRDALIEAHEIAHSVARRLEPFGLDLSADDVPERAPAGDDDQPLFLGRTQGDSTELVLGMLHCRRADSYRQVESLACAAALRYLDFDRAFVLGVDSELEPAYLRSGTDRSTQRIDRQTTTPSPTERAALLEALATGEPRVLVRQDPPQGVCATLAADRLLAVAVPGPWRPATLLLFDRAPTTRMIDIEADGTRARTLAGCAALLLENLELRLRRRRAERDAMTDPLTRLFNRSVGISRLDQELARARRDGTPLCVMMADLDEFKQLNDRLGHLRGDAALRIAADVLRRHCRQEDTVCRYGGEEFLLVLPNTTVENATVLATRLFTAIADAGAEARLPLTISIGLAAWQDGDSLDTLVGRADHALYASKAHGRNRFSAATP